MQEEYLSLMLPVLEEGMKRVSNAARPSRASSLSAKTKQRKAIIAKKNKQMEKDGIFKVVSLASKILATLTVTLSAHCSIQFLSATQSPQEGCFR